MRRAANQPTVSGFKPAMCVTQNRCGHGPFARKAPRSTVSRLAAIIIAFIANRAVVVSLDITTIVCITILIPEMSQSSANSVVQDVVDRLFLTGTVYDDLIRTLGRRPLSRVDGAAAAAAEEPPAAGWTSSELLVDLPSQRAFFRSNPTFPPSYVLASCPNVQGRTTPGAVTVRYYYSHRSAAVDVKQEEQDQVTGDVNDDEQQVEEEKENKMESVTSSKEEMEDYEHHPDDAPSATAVASRPTTARAEQKMQRHTLLATFEDQLVAMVQSAPQQRIEKARLQEEYERLHGRRS
jgi:hypothetical protein